MTLTLRDLLSPLTSFFGGGLAGAVVSRYYNHSRCQRTLPTDSYKKLHNMYSTYVIRFKEKPEGRGRYLVRIIGQEPTGADKDFIEQNGLHSRFGSSTNWKKRQAGQAISDNELREKGTPGPTSKLDFSLNATLWTPA